MLTLKLVLTLRYKQNSTKAAVLMSLLESVVTDALNYGGFTGETPATLEEHRFTITKEIN